ncbi:MAG: histidine kinase [Hirschia sp.]|nr:histidine kinase [Hirschia sp.]
MTRFLQSDDRPEGHKLEDILLTLRSDIIKRCDRISMDRRPEAIHVLNNNVQILKLMSEAIELALDSTRTLDRSFGKSHAGEGGKPRIGVLDEDAA